MRNNLVSLSVRLIKHELITGSFYIFLGAMVSNVLAFFLNLFLARNLSYGDYAIFASLLSLITLAAIPASSINTIIVKFATDYFARKQEHKLKTLYVTFLKFIVFICIAIIAFSFALGSPIRNFLNLDSNLYVIATGLTVCSFYLLVLNNAFLQSLMKFRFISLISAIGGVLKLIIGVVFVFLGYKAYGGIGAIFFMTFAMFILAFIPLLKILRLKQSEKISLNTKEILKYSVPAFITVLFLTSFTSTDVILAKHFFNPHLAGFYAGLSLVGKVIFYFTAPIPTVMFPLLVKRFAVGKNFNNLFYLALALVILPSVLITAFYFIFPNFVVKLFLGGRDYLYISQYLGIFGVYLTVFSMVNVCVNFFLSINKTVIWIFVVGAAILQIVLIFLYHADFLQIIEISLSVLSVLLVILLYIFFKNYGRLGKIRA